MTIHRLFLPLWLKDVKKFKAPFEANLLIFIKTVEIKQIINSYNLIKQFNKYYLLDLGVKVVSMNFVNTTESAVFNWNNQLEYFSILCICILPHSKETTPLLNIDIKYWHVW